MSNKRNSKRTGEFMMKKSSIIFFLFPIFIIQSCEIGQQPPAKSGQEKTAKAPRVFTVRIKTSSTEQHPIESEIKGFLLAELRKIPDVSQVSYDEDFYIQILPHTRGEYVSLSIIFLERFEPSQKLLKAADKADLYWEFYNMKQSYKTPLRHYIYVNYSINDVEELCKRLIVQFDADVLSLRR